MIQNEFSRAFEGKKILVLGHTGFKGSWLTIWLNKLGANVFGASIDIPTKPSHYEVAKIDDICQSSFLDIRDGGRLASYFDKVKPDFVFHLAAQALVGRAYQNPVETFHTNLLGTVNVLECLRRSSNPVTAVLITSDKAYENVEMVHGYRETDRLGGKDPYSASKGCAELAIHAYVESFFSSQNSQAHIGVGRAGNVIGGGDWSAGRLVPDAVKAWCSDGEFLIRSPGSTRPWQHVLEPLSGYLLLASLISKGQIAQGEPYNFGPRSEDLATVADIAKSLLESFEGLNLDYGASDNSPRFHEADLLKLSCDKALHSIDWRPVLTIQEALNLTKEWYQQFRVSPDLSRLVSEDQINRYCELGVERGLPWAGSSALNLEQA
ncbi:CDP-glucose 4,6-dehydratase [Arenicellales bacterium IMCC58067]